MKAVSLFSNVGFGEYYLKSLGVDVVLANEMLGSRCDMYREMHPHTRCIQGDIANYSDRASIHISAIERGDPIDIVIATPPCQGMSVANAIKHVGDPRNTLIVHALEVFNTLQAKYMLIENVPKMPSTYIHDKDGIIKIADFIKKNIPSGYIAKFKTLDGKHYNTPQSRKRSICLISPNGEWDHPEPAEKIFTVRDAIGHLPSLKSNEHSDLPWHFSPKHNKNHIRWMSATPEGETAFNNTVDYPQKNGRRIKGFMTTYKRMFWDKPAPTVTMTNGSISSQNNVHPSDARVLSIRELLCICGLPEDCLDKFAKKKNDGTYEYKYSQMFMRKVIGEMFLPKMCESIIKNLN
jgi:DNA (cytosine-5)-methyltransferase 1